MQETGTSKEIPVFIFAGEEITVNQLCALNSSDWKTSGGLA